eukprot:gene7966-10040_t
MASIITLVTRNILKSRSAAKIPLLASHLLPLQYLRFASRFSQLVDNVRPTIKEIKPVRLFHGEPYQALENQSEYTWVDVREDREWMEKGVVDCDRLVTIERGILEREIEKSVPDATTPLVVYCAGAMRSVLAAESLQRLGYTNVYSLDGGFDSWKENCHPIRSWENLKKNSQKKN